MRLPWIMPNHLHGIVIITENYKDTQKQNFHEMKRLKGKLQQIKGEQIKGEQIKGEQIKGEQIKGEQIKGEQIKGEQIKGERRSPLQGIAKQKPRSLTSLIGGFKASVTRQINQLCNHQNPPIWQRNYYESIIRDEQHLNYVRQYIHNNPQAWTNDPENPKNHGQFQYLLLNLPF
jgi:REP element-mobilizing transposase RayT